MVDVLVTAAGKGDEDGDVLVLALERIGQGVRRLEGGDDSLFLAQQLEGLESLGVGDADVLGTAGLRQVGVLRADARVIRPAEME